MLYHTPHSVCRFGVARRDVTPPVGIYHRMWGAASHDRSEGVHRPLTATAMVFQPLEEASIEPRETYPGDRPEQIVVALDHCLLFPQEMEDMRRQVAGGCALNPENLLFVFSHTHAAGLMERRRNGLPGGEHIEPYLEKLGQNAIEAVQLAQQRLQPATIQYAQGRCSLAAHRDFWDDRRGMFVCGFNPTQPADDTVLAAQITGEGGQRLASIVNYACHPTTLAWDNRFISPDYIGAMREVIEQATGAPCVFLQGAAGELGPMEGFVGDFGVADRNGRQLGYAALSALESLPPPRTRMRYQGPVVSGATIGVWRHEELSPDDLAAKAIWQRKVSTIELPYREELPSQDSISRQKEDWTRFEAEAQEEGDQVKAAEARAMVERMSRWQTRLEGLPSGDAFPFPFTVWRIGDAVWAAVEGEPYSLLQRSLRERFPKTPIMILELANGSRISYLPPKEIYGKQIYQEGLAMVEQGSLEKLIDAIAAEIEEMLT